MRKKMFLHWPQVRKVQSDFFSNTIKLSTIVDYINENGEIASSKECYFEFDEKYADYLVVDRSDTFVLGLLSAAMENDMDIEYEAPLSERLHFQLTVFYIPMIEKYNKKFPLFSIKLLGKTTNAVVSTNGYVATGCSGGVDSFYTIEKYRYFSKRQLTHLICSSSGTLDHNETRIKSNYKKILKNVYKIGIEANLDVIGCFNNLYEFYNYPYKSFHTFFTTTFCSVPYALNRLISVYYASSGHPIELFTLDLVNNNDRDCSAFDVFTTQLITTDNISIYSSGMEVNRNEKIEYIADSELAEKNLAVCGIEIDGAQILNGKLNCSKCKKCLRTMFSLYVIGKLDYFQTVFDTAEFYKNKAKIIGSLIAYDHVEFTKESINRAKKNGIKIPCVSYFYAYLMFKPLEYFRKTLRRFKLIKTIGYKLGLDYLMYGYRRGKN